MADDYPRCLFQDTHNPSFHKSLEFDRILLSDSWVSFILRTKQAVATDASSQNRAVLPTHNVNYILPNIEIINVERINEAVRTFAYDEEKRV